MGAPDHTEPFEGSAQQSDRLSYSQTDGAAIDGIPLKLRVVLGSVSMTVGEVARLKPGSLIKLDRSLGQPVDVIVGERMICRGEIGVTADASPRFVLRVSEIAGRRSPRPD